MPRRSVSSKRAGAAARRGAVRRLAGLLDAGIAVGDALDAGARAGGDAGALLHAIAVAVSRGRTLSQAMTGAAGWTPTDVALIRAGEHSGKLDQALSLLADRMTHDAQTKNRLARALVYPALLVVLTVAIVTAMGVFVVPTFSSMYEGLGVALPTTTRAIIAVGDFMVRYGLATAIVSAALAMIGFWAIRRSPALRAALDSQLLLLPLLGRLARAHTKSDLYGTLAALLDAGIELDRAIALTSPAVGNLAMRGRLMSAGHLIERGWLPSAAISRVGLDPDGHDTGLLKTAESTGRFADACTQIAAIARNERDERIETMSRLFEPLAILVMTFAVGLTVAGVYQPILGSAALLVGDIQ